MGKQIITVCIVNIVTGRLKRLESSSKVLDKCSFDTIEVLTEFLRL